MSGSVATSTKAHHRWPRLLALFATLALAGCAFDAAIPEGATLSCSSDEDCAGDSRCAVVLGRCVTATDFGNVCGDGVLGVGEECDDGPRNADVGDACRTTCSLPSHRDAIVDTDEECDDGNDVDGDGCDANNTRSGCGNGVTAAPEECDDGNLVDGDGCDHNCTFSRCGNGVDAGVEVCDDGNDGDGDGCDANCRPTGCGNGVVFGAEVCDDGNGVDGDGCDANCRPTGCGNGRTTDKEQCDDGNTVDGDGCDHDCTISRCGNGITAGTEECDDGNANDTDECRNSCAAHRCGDGVRQPAFEQCDDGEAANLPGASCLPGCVRNVCGDGDVFDGVEECDDGADNGDDRACLSTCHLNVCGDGHVQRDVEQCDDGNGSPFDGCLPVTCTASRCGDGVVDRLGGIEQCDDGDAANVVGASCLPGCVRNVCGDGDVFDGVEECDDGADNGDDRACLSTCRANVCGDGHVQRDVEQCDDGNGSPFDGCLPVTCTASRCGDGVVDRLGGVEQCDDGDAANVSGASCLPGCVRNVCGDGDVLAGVEECDDGAGNGDDRACLSTCRRNVCGDGHVLHDVEECDDGNSNPFDPCVPGCVRNVCGDGLLNTVDGAETCDDGNVASFDGCSAHCDRVAWRVHVGPGLRRGSGLVLANTTRAGESEIVVGTSAGDVVAVRLSDGVEVWRTPVGAAIASVVARDGIVVVAEVDGAITGLNARTNGAAAPGSVRFHVTGKGTTAGRTRLSIGGDDAVVVMDDVGVLHRVSSTGTEVPFTGNGGNYPLSTATPTTPVPVSCVDGCSTTLGVFNSATLAALVPLDGSLWVWNFNGNCAPRRIALDDGERPIGRATLRRIDNNGRIEIMVVTSKARAVAFGNNDASCTTTLSSATSIGGNFATEPIWYASIVSGGAAYAVPLSDGRIDNFSFSSSGVARLPGWPASLPAGRTSLVPVAVDLEQALYAVDEAGDIHRFNLAGERTLLGTVGGAPSAGPLLVDHGIVVASVTGDIVALEGSGGAPTANGWVREGADVGGTATNAACAQGGRPDAVLLSFGVVLGAHSLRRRRRVVPARA